jgi:hypothetical protein
MYGLGPFGAVGICAGGFVAGKDSEAGVCERGVESGEADFVTDLPLISAEPADAAVAEFVEMLDNQAEGLSFVAIDGMAKAGAACGDTDKAGLVGEKFFEERARYFAEQGETVEEVTCGEKPGEAFGVELLLGAEEHCGTVGLIERGVETLLDVAEIVTQP